MANKDKTEKELEHLIRAIGAELLNKWKIPIKQIFKNDEDYLLFIIDVCLLWQAWDSQDTCFKCPVCSETLVRTTNPERWLDILDK